MNETALGIFDLHGTVALGTGGAGGIGKVMALALEQYGADVAVASRNLANLEVVAEVVRATGRKALALACDVTDEKQVGHMVERTVSELGRLNILVNSAGVAIRKPAEEFPLEDWDQVMDVNVKGTWLPCQAAARHMKEHGGGKIINLSSVRGRYGQLRDYAAYTPSKGAVDALTRTLACEWARFNILVNAIAPTVVDTDLAQGPLKNPKVREYLMRRIPLHRLAEGRDLVGVTIFFASAASDFITGQVLYVDGGVTSW